MEKKIYMTFEMLMKMSVPLEEYQKRLISFTLQNELGISGEKAWAMADEGYKDFIRDSYCYN